MILFRRTAQPLLPPFQFLEPGPLQEAGLELRLVERAAATGDRAPTYRFEMFLDDERAGNIELRIGHSPDILTYTGQIGYRVDERHRGRRLAARGCRLLFELARRHGLRELWLTCDHDNAASYRTCELIGGVLVETVPVPLSHPYYQAGSRQKCRFRVTL